MTILLDVSMKTREGDIFKPNKERNTYEINYTGQWDYSGTV
jgi:hypothetical protein